MLYNIQGIVCSLDLMSPKATHFGAGTTESPMAPHPTLGTAGWLLPLQSSSCTNQWHQYEHPGTLGSLGAGVA